MIDGTFSNVAIIVIKNGAIDKLKFAGGEGGLARIPYVSAFVNSYLTIAIFLVSPVEDVVSL